MIFKTTRMVQGTCVSLADAGRHIEVRQTDTHTQTYRTDRQREREADGEVTSSLGFGMVIPSTQKEHLYYIIAKCLFIFFVS